MTRQLLIFPKADADITDILIWIGRRSPKGASTWYTALLKEFDRIVRDPGSYPLVPEANLRFKRTIHQSLFKTRRGNFYRIILNGRIPKFEFSGFEERGKNP